MRDAFHNITIHKSYLIAETSSREQAQVDAHLPRQLAPAAVHTPSLRTTDSLIAFPSTPAARLPEDVACCSRVFTRGRQKGRVADNISVARVLLPVASASRATTVGLVPSRSFRSSPGQIFDSLNSATIRCDTAKKNVEIARTCYRYLSRGLRFIF